jgi:eukaryotic-like serine/threonine-protein kinase
VGRRAPGEGRAPADARIFAAVSETPDGKYEVLSKLKEGGMGEIFLVHHRLLDERRVVKVMRPQLAGRDSQRRRFQREAQTVTKLRHPNIALCHDFVVDSAGTSYMVMEFVDGINLRDLLAGRGPLPPPLAVEIAVQTLGALGYLHKREIIHRDISPENIMLSRDEEGLAQAKIIDLGIAKTRHGDEATATDVFVGKLRYSSPEQLKSSVPIDGRSDLYSLAAVLYELLTRRPAFGGNSLPAIVAAHTETGPEPFESTDPGGGIAAPLRQVLQRGLSRALEDRYQTAREFAEALRAALPAGPSEEGARYLDGAFLGNGAALLGSAVSSSERAALAGILDQVSTGSDAAAVRPPFASDSAAGILGPEVADSGESDATWELEMPSIEPAKPAATPPVPPRAPVPAASKPPAPPVAPVPRPPAAGQAPTPAFTSIPVPTPARPPAAPAPLRPPSTPSTPPPAPAPLRPPSRPPTPLAAPAPPRPPSTPYPPPAAPAPPRPASAVQPRPVSTARADVRNKLPVIAGAGLLAAAILVFVLARPRQRPAAAPVAPVAPAESSTPPPPAPAPSAAPSGPAPIEERAYRDYVARILPADASGLKSLEVLYRGQIVHQLKGTSLHLGADDARGKPDPAAEMGKEIIPETPSLVVSESSPTPRCCLTVHVFDVGDNFRAFAPIATGAARGWFQEVPGSGRRDFITTDPTFAGWRGFDLRPAVSLRPQEGAYRLDSELMQKEPDEAELARRADWLRASFRGAREPAELPWTMLTLVYSGHANVAFQFCQRAWPDSRPGKQAFLQDFRARLAQSPYWPSIRAMNSNM